MATVREVSAPQQQSLCDSCCNCTTIDLKNTDLQIPQLTHTYPSMLVYPSVPPSGSLLMPLIFNREKELFCASQLLRTLRPWESS